MKKIIKINLSGRVIPIEDSAYEMLQAYIESLRRYFSNEDGRDEIINDIESRIAELMNEKIRKGSNEITEDDMNEIIGSMGRVEDFEEVDKESAAASSTTSAHTETAGAYSETSAKKERRRLYRDSSDKIIGGVCSGIASYLNIDPAIVRILFAIMSFGGGFGFLLYIILWIVLPPRDLDDYSGKRLYRNPNDKVIAGVAGGLAAYFGRSATTIRLIFAAPLILNIIFGIFSGPFIHTALFPNIIFGSFTGTFIFAYIVLWIVLPQALSDYQKMEMRGEKVDVNRIRQNVKDSAQNLASRAKEFANTRGKAFASEAGYVARKTGRGIGHVFGVLFKAFFLFIAGTIAFALFVALIGILIGGVSVWPLKDFLLDGFWQNTYAWGTLILFLGVPLLGFIIWLLRRIMRVRSQHNYLGWTFGGLWTLGWVCLFLFGASLFNDFRMNNYSKEATQIPISQPVNGKMIVQVSEPELEYSGSIPWFDVDGHGLDITNDSLRTANIRINEPILSEDSNYHVEIKRYSCGRTILQAEEKALKIRFDVLYKDSLLDLGSSISLDKASKFRGQQVIVQIHVPAGKKIRFDETINKLHSFDIKINERRRYGRRTDWKFSDDVTFVYRTNVNYTMGADGVLKDEKGVKAGNRNNDYRYPESDSIRKKEEADWKLREIEEQQRKIKESERRIRELQDQKNSSSFSIGPSPSSFS